MDKADRILSAIEQLAANLTARIDGVEAKIDGVEAKIDGVETKLTGQIAVVAADVAVLKAGQARLEADVSEIKRVVGVNHQRTMGHIEELRAIVTDHLEGHDSRKRRAG